LNGRVKGGQPRSSAQSGGDLGTIERVSIRKLESKGSYYLRSVKGSFRRAEILRVGSRGSHRNQNNSQVNQKREPSSNMELSCQKGRRGGRKTSHKLQVNDKKKGICLYRLGGKGLCSKEEEKGGTRLRVSGRALIFGRNGSSKHG